MPEESEVKLIRTDVIECPNCGAQQEAEVTWTKGHPWPSFVHTCTECEYLIGESEWNSVSVEAWQKKELQRVLDKIA